MKKIFLPLFAFALAACSAPVPSPTPTASATFTPPPTATLTVTPSPSPTLTATPLPLPPIETVPFNEKTYKNLPELDVAAWEAAAGRALTPKDIIEASKLGEPAPFPSDALVVGFYPRHDPLGSIIMEPIVDKEVKADMLPMTYEAVMLTNAQSMIPDSFEKLGKENNAPVDKWIAFTWRVNTPSGELTGVMITDGYFLDGTGKRKTSFAQDLLEGTGVVAGKEDWTMTPMTKMPTVDGRADVFGSSQAKATWKEVKAIQEKIQEAMAGADLTKEEDLKKLQELFDENWLFMGGTVDRTIKVK